MRDEGGNPSQAPKLSLHAEATAYLAAFFSIGLQPMANVVVPLWAIHLGIPPLLFGIVMGSRSLLPFLFAIHGGVLIDRFGAGRVMTCCAITTGVAYPGEALDIAHHCLPSSMGYPESTQPCQPSGNTDTP